MAPSKGQPDLICERRGFILLACLLALTLATLLILMSHARLARRIQVQMDLERGLYSMAAAADGIEMTKTILPSLDLTQVGLSPEKKGSTRNPLTREVALTSTLEELNRLFSASAWPFENGTDAAWPLQGAAAAFVRLSNNPEEDASGLDRDGVVIVRSMGVAASQSRGFFPEVRNSVTVVEARLRRERLFEPPAAVLIFAAHAEIETDGTSCPEIQSDNQAVFGIVSRREQPLAQVLLFTSGQGESCFTQESEGIQDFTEEYVVSPTRERLFQHDFWEHFLTQLPNFTTESLQESFQYFPQGGTIEGETRGIVVARGPLLLSEGALFKGLLIHLGEGPLQLASGAQVEGALWMASPAPGVAPDSGSVTFVMADRTRIVLDRDEIEKALWLFPPTQLGWRVLAPEME